MNGSQLHLRERTSNGICVDEVHKQIQFKAWVKFEGTSLPCPAASVLEGSIGIQYEIPHAVIIDRF